VLRNYLKTTFINLARNKIYSFINIFGLSAGLACFILIALYIFDELTFDRFHKNVHNIFRVVEEKTTAEGIKSKVASVAYNVSTHAAADLPEVSRVARVGVLGRSNISNDENTKAFYEDFWIVSSDFF
jgi:putative ABC transport system permease protein